MKVIFLLLFLFCSVASAKNIHLTTYNVCSLEGQVNGDSMYKLKKCLDKKVALRKFSTRPIYLYINSGGGNIHDGLRFISYAKQIKNLHTITEYGASMAAAIGQLLPGKRFIVEHGVIMFHRARGGVQGQFEGGELESRLMLWKRIVRKMESDQAKRIGITLREYKQRRMNEWWLYGDQAISQNVSDQVVGVTCSTRLSESRHTEKVRGFFGSHTIEVSDCPLVN